MHETLLLELLAILLSFTVMAKSQELAPESPADVGSDQFRTQARSSLGESITTKVEMDRTWGNTPSTSA